MKKIIVSILLCVLTVSFCFTSLNCKKRGKNSESESTSSISSSVGGSDSEISSDSSQTPPTTSKKELSDLVDFIVPVETGRDIRVLQLTDIQTISGDTARFKNRGVGSSKSDIFTGYQRYIGQVIERYNPDFIIMTGDNVYGEFDDNGEQLISLINFMDSFEIPWSPVFGNHDNESFMGVDWQCEQYVKSKYCLFKQGDLTGNSNYSVALTQGGEVKRVFYMLDSNGCGNMSQLSFANGHSKISAGFASDQIDWYTQSITDLKSVYPNVKLSMAFHIQLTVFGDAFKKYGYSESTIRNNPINLDKNSDAKAKGDFGYIGRELKGAWDSDKKVWNSIKSLGIDSVFVGHEHCNSASVVYEGVRLSYGQKSSSFDRYNLTKSDGTITNTSITYSGTPIMGGTRYDLSKEDGSIKDAGLYLYDHDLGYEKPEEKEITYDTIPASATKTEFDFNDEDFDLTVTTATINGGQVSKTDADIPSGYSGDVYSKTTSDLASVGVKFNKKVNVDKLLAIFVKMYVTDYQVVSGKEPLLRIYNSTENNYLSQCAYSSIGGENNKWVYLNILDIVKSSSGIVNGDGSLNPFTLLYRFYGVEQGTIYFDSLTLVSNGSPYEFDAPVPEGCEVIKGQICKKFSFSEYSAKSVEVSKENPIAIRINESSYSFSFTMNYATLNNGLYIYGYCSKNDPVAGLSISIGKKEVKIDNQKRSTEGYTLTYSNTLNANTNYAVEVGFVNLYNGNTVYVYVKINGTMVGWELAEAYGKPIGSVVMMTENNDKITIS